MGTNLKNILRFTDLEVGVPLALPHLLNVNGRGVVPRIGGANAGGIDFTANTTTVTATRTADGPDAVDVYVEYWHTIEALVPQNTALGTLTPLFFAGGGGGGGTPIVEHFSGNGQVDPPQVVNPAADVVYVQNTEAESTLQFTLAAGLVDGHQISFISWGSTNTRPCTITVANFDPEEAGNEITIGDAGPSGNFTLSWNADEGYWQINGTPRNATIA